MEIPPMLIKEVSHTPHWAYSYGYVSVFSLGVIFKGNTRKALILLRKKGCEFGAVYMRLGVRSWLCIC